ncbi:MAG: DUF502 domain-containing protein [Candidatus Omnitrophica bacterium]|nr:DUF502 domain-containing protein [Candidatus Omnitrophota bacterium]
MLRRLRNYFLSGLLIVVPISITVWIIWGIFNLFDGWFRRLVTDSAISQSIQTYYYIPQYGVGFFLTVSLIILTGFMTQLYLGRKVFELIDRIFLQIPFISNLYHGLKQVTETLMGKRKRIFEQVVLFEYPRKGLYSLGFIIAHDQKLIEPITKKSLVYVFVATTPNPTSGIFLIIPEEELTPLDISAEDAMKMIISSGMVAPSRAHEVPLDQIPSPRTIEEMNEV